MAVTYPIHRLPCLTFFRDDLFLANQCTVICTSLYADVPSIPRSRLLGYLSLVYTCAIKRKHNTSLRKAGCEEGWNKHKHRKKTNFYHFLCLCLLYAHFTPLAHRFSYVCVHRTSQCELSFIQNLSCPDENMRSRGTSIRNVCQPGWNKQFNQLVNPGLHWHIQFHQDF